MSPESKTTPTSMRTLDQDAQTVGRAAASELSRLLPSTVPLRVTAHDPAAAPAADAVAVRAHFVGATSADLVVVADQAIAAALEGADASISLADALRPALEAAAATLGAGVLDPAQAAPIAGELDDDGVVAFALCDDAGTAQAWFAIRVHARTQTIPTQRSAQSSRSAADERASLRLLHDVEMTLTAEIGRTRLPVRQVLDLVPGTVLELDRAAGSPADIMVNGRLVARGEVVVIDEDYGIRITEIVSVEAGS